MSNALAIAGVTAVLRDLLDSGMIDHAVTDAMGQGVAVTAVAPDTIAITGNEAKPQINIFMYHATQNAALRNMAMPGRGRDGTRIGNPPLALDLHYLVSAYGTSDLQAEVLLGYAMQLLHETPVPSRDAIRTALNPPGSPVDGALLPSVYRALRASDLAEQIEQIRISPAPMNTEEMSKLWSAMQAHYRPTAAYQASVVMIESTQPTRSALPVLTRGKREPSLVDPTVMREQGVLVNAGLSSAYPDIDDISLPAGRVAAHLGDAVVLTGRNLDGSNHALVLSLPRLGIEHVVSPATSVGAGAIGFTLPNLPASLPPGAYLVTLQLVRPGDTAARISNPLMLKLAPQPTSLTSPPQVFARDGDGTAAVTVVCTPQVQPNQRASLILGSREINANPRTTATASLDFDVVDAPVGTHWVRLRVDGVESELVDRTIEPPVFLDLRIRIA